MPEKVQYELSLNDLLTPKLDNAEKSANKLESTLGHVQGALAGFGEKVLAIGETLGISFAFYRLEEFAHEGIEMAHQLGQAEAQLKAGIISTNGAAGVSYEELEKSAMKYAATLPYTRAQIVDMQSQLITFPGVTAKVFDEASQAILDMSTRLHRGLDETAIQVGKALQDPIKGVTALRRVGVDFDATQTALIKKLVETGHAGQAQALILRELQTEFAGSAKAAADADPLFKYNKLMESIKMAVGEAGESLLHDLTPGLETAATMFKQGYEYGVEFFGYIKANVPAILTEVKQDFIALAAGIGVAIAAYAIINPMVIAYTFSVVANGIATAGLTVATYALTAAQWLLNVALEANPIGIVVVAIGALITGLVYAYEHSEKFRAVIAGIGAVAKDLWGILKGLGETIIGVFTLNPAKIKQGLVDSAQAMFSIAKDFSKSYEESIAESHSADAKGNGKTRMGELNDKNKKPRIAPTKIGGTGTMSTKVTGTRITTINIKIDKLADIKISTTNLRESASKIHDAVTQSLLAACNDSQLVVEGGN